MYSVRARPLTLHLGRTTVPAMQVAIEEPEIKLAHETGITATYRNVVINYWHGESNVAAVDSARRALKEVTRAHPGSAVYITATAIGSAPPNEVREAWMAMMRESDGKVRAAAVIAAVSGFEGSVVRGVTTGMLLVARPSIPIKVFDSAAAGAKFLAASYLPGSAGATVKEIVELHAWAQRNAHAARS